MSELNSFEKPNATGWWFRMLEVHPGDRLWKLTYVSDVDLKWYAGEWIPAQPKPKPTMPEENRRYAVERIRDMRIMRVGIEYNLDDARALMYAWKGPLTDLPGTHCRIVELIEVEVAEISYRQVQPEEMV